MIDNDTLERIGLRALDLADPEAAEQLERQLACDTGYQPYADEMDEVVAALALAAPQYPAPARALGGALVRVGGTARARRRFGSVAAKGNWRWWAAAAAVAVALCTAFWAGRGSAGRAGELVEDNRDGKVESRVESPSGGGRRGAFPDAGGREDGRPRGAETLSALPGREPWRVRRGMLHDIERLRQAVGDLRREREQRLVGVEGMAKPSIIQMLEPDTERAGDDPAHFARSMADIIASAIADRATAEIDSIARAKQDLDPEDDPIPQGTQPEEENAAGGVEVPPAATLDERTLPENFEGLREGFYWDHNMGELWVRSERDGLLVQVPVPDGFDYEEIEDYPEIDAIQAGTLPAPDTEPLSKVPPPSAELEAPLAVAPADAVAADPWAYAVFLEATGDGEVVVFNLPESAPGENYHLWLRDSLDGRIVPVGILPENLAPVERIEFPPGLLGVSPSGFVLTRENSINATSPSNNIVLEGPQLPPTKAP